MKTEKFVKLFENVLKVEVLVQEELNNISLEAMKIAEEKEILETSKIYEEIKKIKEDLTELKNQIVKYGTKSKLVGRENTGGNPQHHKSEKERVNTSTETKLVVAKE